MKMMRREKEKEKEKRERKVYRIIGYPVDFNRRSICESASSGVEECHRDVATRLRPQHRVLVGGERNANPKTVRRRLS